MNKRWKKVADAQIRHRWDLVCGCDKSGGTMAGQEVALGTKTVYVSPAFYEDAGTPICEDCGQDRVYRWTEVRQ